MDTDKVVSSPLQTAQQFAMLYRDNTFKKLGITPRIEATDGDYVTAFGPIMCEFAEAYAASKTAEILKERDMWRDEYQAEVEFTDSNNREKLKAELQLAQQTIRDLTEKEQFLSNQLINLQADYDKLKSSPLK